VTNLTEKTPTERRILDQSLNKADKGRGHDTHDWEVLVMKTGDVKRGKRIKKGGDLLWLKSQTIGKRKGRRHKGRQDLCVTRGEEIFKKKNHTPGLEGRRKDDERSSKKISGQV